MSGKKLIASCIQTNTGPDIAANLVALEPMIKEAKARGAQFIALPENVDSLLPAGQSQKRARKQSEHPAIPFFTKMAKETGAWILAGSMAILPDEKTDHDKVFNRSYLFNADGKIVAHYDKIHMFDA